MAKMMRVQDIAGELGVSVPTAYRVVRELQSVKQGRYRTFDADIAKSTYLQKDSTRKRKQQEEPIDFVEMGSAAFQRRGERVVEERLRQLRGREGRILLREMRLNDPVIAAVFLAIENALRRVTWRVQAASESLADLEVAEFIENCLFEDQSFTWTDTMQFILNFLEQGFSLVELTYKRRLGQNPPIYIPDPAPSLFDDGRIGWRKWAPRPAESLTPGREWVIDDHGGIQGIRQDTGDKRGTVEIPIDRLLLFRTTVAPANSPEGLAIHRAAFVPWHMSNQLQEVEGIGIERDLAGLPVVYMGSDTRKRGSNNDFEQAKDIVTNLRIDEQAGVVFPYPKLGLGGENRGILLELLTSPGRHSFNAQPLSAKILTPTGWMRMADAKIGDKVICPLGYTSEIIGVYPRGKRSVYRVTMMDGRTTECDIDHLWVFTNLVWRSRAKKFKLQGAHSILKDHKVLSTQELIDEMESPKYKLNQLHIVSSTQPVEFQRLQPLPVDPYILGVLLGDGWLCKQGGAPQFVSADEGIVEEVRKRLPVGYIIAKRVVPSMGKASQYTISYMDRTKGNKISESLEMMGLRAAGARGKFIPGPYLWSSVEDRLEVLRGLMDTDGCILKTGAMYLSTVSETLALNTLQLVRSLGGSASITSTYIKEMIRPSDKAKIKIGRVHYKVSHITLPEGIIPFRLSRKVERCQKRKCSSRHNEIKSIDHIGETDVQCIMVSSPSQMYVTDDFIPTHNTSAVIARYDRLKALSMLAQFIILGMENVGSYALGRLQADIFVLAVSAFATNIAETINRFAIPRLLRYNVFPQATPYKYPKLVPSDVGIPNLEEMAIYVNTLVGAGLLKPDQELEKHLRQIAHLPQKEDIIAGEQPEDTDETPMANDRQILRAARAGLILNRLRLLLQQGQISGPEAERLMAAAKRELLDALGVEAGGSEVFSQIPVPKELEEEEEDE